MQLAHPSRKTCDFPPVVSVLDESVYSHCSSDAGFHCYGLEFEEDVFWSDDGRRRESRRGTNTNSLIELGLEDFHTIPYDSKRSHHKFCVTKIGVNFEFNSIRLVMRMIENYLCSLTPFKLSLSFQTRWQTETSDNF